MDIHLRKFSNIKTNPCNTRYGLQGLYSLNNVDLQFIL